MNGKVLVNRIIIRTVSFALAVFSLATLLLASSQDAFADDTPGIAVSGFALPHPGAVPDGGKLVFEPSDSCSLLGWMWIDDDYECIVSSDSETARWYAENFVLANSFSLLTKFDDGVEYRLVAILGLTTVQSGQTDIPVIFNDSESNKVYNDNARVMTASEFARQVPVEVKLPEAIREYSGVCVIDSKFMCSEIGHIHDTLGSYVYDGQYHWRTCSKCGISISGTKTAHSSDYITENWTVIGPTQTRAGIWVKECGCGKVIDSISEPALRDQTIVSSYEELKAALAKGGTQWISLSSASDNSWIRYTDTTAGQTLTVDSSDADITLNMNGMHISRVADTDNCLFDIQQGSLRIISETASKDLSAAQFWFSGKNAKSVFNVAVGAKLRLSNVHAFTYSSTGAYCVPTVVSKGIIQIDGGYFTNLTPCLENDPELFENPALRILDGEAEINGGEFAAAGCAVSAGGTSDGTPCITINNCRIYAETVGCMLDSGTSATINGGEFSPGNTGNKQDKALIFSGDRMTVNGGYFNGEVSGMRIEYARSVDINGGIFCADAAIHDTHNGSLYIGVVPPKCILYGGSYEGNIGIGIYKNHALRDYLCQGARAVNNKGYFISDNVPAMSYGGEGVSVMYNGVKITAQPLSDTVTVGETALFSVMADGAASFNWQVLGNDNVWRSLYQGLPGQNSAEDYSAVSIDVVSATEEKQIRCVISGYNGEMLTSDAVSLKVSTLGFSLQPYDTIGVLEKTAVFNVSAVNAVSYQWQEKLTTGVWRSLRDVAPETEDGIPSVSGARTDTLSVVTSVQRNGALYRCIITDKDGEQMMSNSVKLTAVNEDLIVREVSLNIKSPVAGEYVMENDEVTLNGVGYKVTGMTWISGGDIRFFGGKTYSVEIVVSSDSASKFASDCTVQINGEQAEVINSGQTGSETSLTVRYTFPETEIRTFPGDTNCDMIINIKDASLIQKYSAKLEDITPQGLINAEVTGDTIVNIKDATRIQKIIAGLV